MESKKNLTRRDFLKLTTVVSTGALVAACAPAAPAPAAPAAPAAKAEPTKAAAAAAPTAAPAAKAPITVRLWVAWGNMNKLFQDEVWYKMPEYPVVVGDNIKIEYKGNAGEAVTTAIAAGDPPEAASNISYAQLAIKDVFLDTQPLVDTSKYIKQSDYIPAIWDFCKFYTFKGLLGVPAFESYLDYGLNYNTKLVKAAGLDPEKPPTTFSEALEWSKALLKKDAAGNLKQFGLDPYDAMGGDPDGIQMATNFKWWDDKTAKFAFTDPKVVEYITATKPFYDLVGADQIAGLRQAEGMGGWGPSYNAEAQAMITEGYWHAGETMVQAPDVAKFNKSSWALVIDANKGKKVQEAGGHTLGIFKDSKYPKEAFKLGEFFNQDTPLTTIFKEVGWILGKKPWMAKSVKADAYPGLDFIINNVDNTTDWFELRRCPLHGYLWNQWSEVREMVYRGKLTPAQGAAEMQKRAETEWKNQGLPS